jgi:hypothetical protein
MKLIAFVAIIIPLNASFLLDNQTNSRRDG